jgi:hypothetical protein
MHIRKTRGDNHESDGVSFRRLVVINMCREDPGKTTARAVDANYFWKPLVDTRVRHGCHCTIGGCEEVGQVLLKKKVAPFTG